MLKHNVKKGDTVKVSLRDEHHEYNVNGTVICVPKHRRFATVQYRIFCGIANGVERWETVRTCFWIKQKRRGAA